MWIGSQRQWKPMEAGNSRTFKLLYTIHEVCSEIPQQTL